MSKPRSAEPGPPMASNNGAPLVAWIEAGGTKFNLAVGYDWHHPLAERRLATADPVTTLSAAQAFLSECEAVFGAITGIGIATFGPVTLDPGQGKVGCLGVTPKPGWSGITLGPLLAGGRPFAVDTDVNAAAIAETRWGAGCDVADLAYVTVGTGLGLGLVLDGRPRHGLLHPEAGHLALRRQPGDMFAGTCPFHGACAEGLLSGPALLARLGRPLDLASSPHADVTSFADYLGQLCATIVLVASVRRIIIGGGVMARLPVHDRVEASMRRCLANYLPLPDDSFIVAPGLGERSGMAGAFALAIEACRHVNHPDAFVSESQCLPTHTRS